MKGDLKINSFLFIDKPREMCFPRTHQSFHAGLWHIKTWCFKNLSSLPVFSNLGILRNSPNTLPLLRQSQETRNQLWWLLSPQANTVVVTAGEVMIPILREMKSQRTFIRDSLSVTPLQCWQHASSCIQLKVLLRERVKYVICTESLKQRK